MVFSPTLFVDDNPPGISAAELNKMGDAIRTAMALALAVPDIRVSSTAPTEDLSVGTVWISYTPA